MHKLKLNCCSNRRLKRGELLCSEKGNRFNRNENQTNFISGSTSIETSRRNFNIDWRAKKPDFNEQLAHFYMKDEMADVEFIFNRHNIITVRFFAELFILIFLAGVFRRFRPMLLHFLLHLRFFKRSSAQQMSKPNIAPNY